MIFSAYITHFNMEDVVYRWYNTPLWNVPISIYVRTKYYVCAVWFFKKQYYMTGHPCLILSYTPPYNVARLLQLHSAQ